jgi:hypothetical protein
MSTSARITIVLLLAAGLGAPGPALANGRFPATDGALGDASNPQQLLAQATFGLLLSSDNGASWRWICEQSIGFAANYDPYVAFTADGALLATTVFGLGRSTDGGCTFVPATGLPADQRTGMLAVHSSDPGIVLAAIEADPSNPTADGRLFRSVNGGQAWASVMLPSGTLALSGLFFQTAQPDRVLMAAPTDANTLILVSDDAGLDIVRVGLILEGQLRLVGLGKARPDQLYLARDGDQPALLTVDLDTVNLVRPTIPTTSLTDTPGRINGVVETPGGTLLVATSNGVLRSTDEGMTWETLAHPHANCVAAAGDGALVCARNFDVQERYGLGRIDDTGTVTPLLHFEDIVGPVECPAGTPTHDSCGALFPNLIASFGGLAPPLDDGGPGTGADAATGGDGGDGGATGRGAPASSGCSMVGQASGTPGWPGAALAALAAVLLALARACAHARARHISTQ